VPIRDPRSFSPACNERNGGVATFTSFLAKPMIRKESPAIGACSARESPWDAAIAPPPGPLQT
jgi:hypothetical protein